MNDLALRPELPFNVISLCAGGRGLDRALELAIPRARSVVYVERESFAVAGLVAQIEAGLVAPAAVWSDVRTFPGRRVRGLVDCVIGGIPCQPHSLAGRRGGSTDERDLWSPRGARRLIVQIRPKLVVIENVGGFLSARDDQVPGAERVRRDLQKLGYAVTGSIVRASDMGLPHERERVFVIGVADHAGSAWRDWLLRTSGASARPGELPDRGHGSAVCPANDEMADAGNRGAIGEPRDLRGAAFEDRSGETDGTERHTGNGRAELQPAGVGLADPGSSRLQGRGQAGDRSGKWKAAERGGQQLVDAQGVGRREGWPEPELRRGRRAADGAGDALVNAIGGGHDGRPEGALGRSVGRDAEQLARADGGRPGLRPPGPGDAAAWRIIAAERPDLLPALSGYDRFRIAMRDEGLAPDSTRPPAHLDAETRQRRAVEGGSPDWVDARTGEPVHPSVVQAATQSALRRVADVMATWIDELRLLGNGVADAQGGLAIRIGLHDLAASGSAGAAELVRMMGEP